MNRAMDWYTHFLLLIQTRSNICTYCEQSEINKKVNLLHWSWSSAVRVTSNCIDIARDRKEYYSRLRNQLMICYDPIKEQKTEWKLKCNSRTSTRCRQYGSPNRSLGATGRRLRLVHRSRICHRQCKFNTYFRTLQPNTFVRYYDDCAPWVAQTMHALNGCSCSIDPQQKNMK